MAKRNIQQKKIQSIPQMQLLIIQFVIIIIFGIILIVSIISTNQINSELINQIRESKEQLDIIHQSLLLLTNDTNILREQIGMSKKDYPILRSKREQEQEQDPVLLFFRAVEMVNKRNQEEKQLVEFHEFKSDPEFQKVLKEYSLELVDQEPYTLDLYKAKNKYFTFIYSPSNKNIKLTATTTSEIYDGLWSNDAVSFIKRSLPALDKHFAEVLKRGQQLATIRTKKQVISIVKQNDLVLSNLTEDRERYYFTVSLEKQIVITVTVEKHDFSYTINSQVVDSFDELLLEFISALENIDTREEQEINLEQAQKELEAILKDQNFIRLLESIDTKISFLTHENDYFIYYDILQDSEKIGCFALDKYNYEIYITDKD